ncbi:hypothetical protein B0I37DRAFT_437684 [Chaetomium sp. MPI-CAGE-AT-0009]|nr:hypothetical protein B0I37DRAFT_437684 [Chaetomium sp. MPI-CAGE-AT-0009]
MLRSFTFLVFPLLLAVAHGDIVLFPWTSNDGSFGNAVDAVSGFGNSQPISTQCASALNQTVACDPQMQQLAASGYVVSLDGASSSLCDPQCNSSLVAYRTAVTSACGASGAFDTYANTWRGDVIFDYFNMVCDKDPGSGEYCPKWLKEQYAANGNPGLEGLPDAVLCSHCQINNMRTVQNSVFLGYNEAMVETYKKIFARCNVDAATTPKPPPEVTFPNTQGGANRTCLSGKTYTTKEGDTCHSIALAESVAEDTLASINDLMADCARLTLESDTTFNLCLPQSCETTQTGASDDCWSISSQHNISVSQFIAYNPAINGDCTNLRPNGTVVCISSPDGSYVPVPLPGSNSSWALGEYADNVVPAPGNTPFGTTENCGAYYQVQVADTCNRVSLAAKVSVALFQDINPSIDAECANLIPDLWYCVHPTYDWNVTFDGTIPPPPTPTGTTGECYKWHVIVPNDSCALLQNTLGVTMAQLVAWNPDLKPDCSNLLLDAAYCVQGPPLPSTTTTTTPNNNPTTTAAATRTTSATASPTSTSAACAQTYAVQAGDWCAKIWEQFGLTEAAFRALNPALNAACDIDVGQVLCVAAPSGCAKTYTVVAGDWCAKVWEQFGLSEAAFRALNPGLGEECVIEVGQRLCVG